ncbi:hypothetical protein BD626DRAFT_394366 [Schizophyllum amplum]|uniref:Vacuole protein n=1 Tax=Schizophyllum amplum TaxID=97359 RepID=A0A550CT42_9AGAR|nr:hypothetical protein BD626DRAFT_394366 [Auriculariopsis ampla]
MCCSGPKWKREQVPDHKFDFVDTREFTDNGFVMRMKYLWLYIICLKDFLVYVSDIFSAITMLTTESWSNEIFNSCGNLDGCVNIPFSIGKWIFVGCIIFSFLLLGYESRKAKKIVASRDISYAFTNVMANHYYSLRSYDCFCFFDHISNSTKTSDDFAFFVFFTFKSWKRVLLADGPRQTINALTLYAVWLVKHNNDGDWYDVTKYFDDNSPSTSALMVTTFFTVTVFAGSLFLLIAAGVCYVPLLCHIRGNLKEYCCHKVDKRIAVVIKRRNKQRIAENAKQARKEAMGDFSHVKDGAKALPQPTLPQLSVDDDDDAASTMHGASSTYNTYKAPSTYTAQTGDNYYYADKGEFPPPMPPYNPYSTAQAPSVYGFNGSQATFAEDPNAYSYDDDNESHAHLVSSAAPVAVSTPTVASYGYPTDRPGTAAPDPYQQQQNYGYYDGAHGDAAQQDAYGGYGQQDAYGGARGTPDPYGVNGAHGTQDPYGVNGAHDPYGGYSQQSPYQGGSHGHAV